MTKWLATTDFTLDIAWMENIIDCITGNLFPAGKAALKKLKTGIKERKT